MKSQQGFSLLILVFLLLVAGMVTMNHMREKQARDADDLAQTYVDALLKARDAQDTYATLNWARLTSGQAVPGVADALHPTVEELRGYSPMTPTAAKLLKGMAISTEIRLSPVGCQPENCRSDTRIWSSPVNNQAAARQQLAENILIRLGRGNAGMTSTEHPAEFRQLGGAVLESNPGAQVDRLLIRGGEVNIPNRELAMRGNLRLSANWNVGSRSVTDIKLANTNSTQIQDTVSLSGPCTHANSLAKDPTGRLVSCVSGQWVPAAVPVTSTESQNVNQSGTGGRTVIWTGSGGGGNGKDR